MEWDFKKFAWDSIEFEEEMDSGLAALVGSSSLGGKKNRGGFMVDLKLGTIADLEDRSVDALKDPGASKMVSSPSGPSKRARLLGGTQTAVSCLVDGCKSDLSICREYHRRHRVCERHSKTPVVIVGGKEQRFCQQCSRFHLLAEFDEVKRSCRKRLDGHNMRRRKSQPESLYTSSGNFLSDYKGPRILQFSTRSMWPLIPTSDQRLDRQNPPNSFACVYSKEDKLFSLLQENDPKLGNPKEPPEVSVYQPFPTTIGSLESGRGSPNMLSHSHGKTVSTQSIDLGCALYLLSSHQTQTSPIGLSHLVNHSNMAHHPNQPLGGSGQQLNGVALAQAQCSWLHQSHGTKQDDKFAGLVSDANETNTYNCNDMFQFHGALDGLLENEAFRKLPISWE